MRTLLTVATLMLAAAGVPSAMGQAPAVDITQQPGTAAASRIERMTATISAIDPKTRQVTLKRPDGGEVTVYAGKEVKNLTQMKVGDRVDAQYTEALTLKLKKGGSQAVGRTERGGKTGAGERPGGVAGRTVTVVAEVVDLDDKRRTVTLRGPRRTVELPVNDPEQFKRLAKGDKVEATYTEAFAVALYPAK